MSSVQNAQVANNSFEVFGRIKVKVFLMFYYIRKTDTDYQMFIKLKT